MQIVEHSVVGTRSAVLRLRCRGAELRFVVFPMFHVASPQFYADVADRLRTCDLLVVEGVKGRSVVGRALTLSYRVMPANRRSGLVLDNIPYAELGVPFVNPDVTADEFARDWRAMSWWVRLLAWCVLPFVVLTQFFGGRRRLLSPEVEVSDLAEANPDDAVNDTTAGRQLSWTISGERDRRLLDALSEIVHARSAERIDVAVVYGAGHTPAIVRGLYERHRYRPYSSEWLTLIAPSLPESPVATVPRSRRRAEAKPPPAAEAAPPPRASKVLPEAMQVALVRQMAAKEPDAYQPALAGALEALATRLGQLGRREEALAAADEVVDLYDELEERHPGSYRRQLGIATSNFGLHLAMLGRDEDALTVNLEAVAMLRRVGRNDPGARADGLGHALTNLSIRLAVAGRGEEALDAARESVELYEAAQLESPRRRVVRHSRALECLAYRLGELGRSSEAVDAARRAVNLCRDRGVTPSPELSHQLASALYALAFFHDGLGQYPEALTAAEESLDIERRIAPTLFGPTSAELAHALQRKAIGLSRMGRAAEALTLDEEALPIWRALAEAYPRSQLDALAQALSSHAVRLAIVGRHDDASVAAQEALTTAASLPDSRMRGFALYNVAVAYGRLGQHVDGLVAAEQSVGVWRRLANVRDGSLAKALRVQADRLAALGRVADAEAARCEASALEVA